jgi:hypothetical protein
VEDLHLLYVLASLLIGYIHQKSKILKDETYPIDPRHPRHIERGEEPFGRATSYEGSSMQLDWMLAYIILYALISLPGQKIMDYWANPKKCDDIMR